MGGSGMKSSSKRVRAPRGEHKDGKYVERRKRNNVAAKKSRDARKQREDEIAIRASYLEKENSILKAQLLTLKDEAQQLRILLAQKKSAAAAAAAAAAVSNSNMSAAPGGGGTNGNCANCSNCSALAAAAAAVASNKPNGGGMYGMGGGGNGGQASCYDPLDHMVDTKNNVTNGGNSMYLPHQPRHQIM
jgi:hypothetical protein